MDFKKYTALSGNTEEEKPVLLTAGFKRGPHIVKRGDDKSHQELGNCLGMAYQGRKKGLSLLRTQESSKKSLCKYSGSLLSPG